MDINVTEQIWLPNKKSTSNSFYFQTLVMHYYEIFVKHLKNLVWYVWELQC